MFLIEILAKLLEIILGDEKHPIYSIVVGQGVCFFTLNLDACSFLWNMNIKNCFISSVNLKILFWLITIVYSQGIDSILYISFRIF